MQFKQPGPWLFAVGMIAFGVTDLLQIGGGIFWPISILCLITSGVGLLFERTGRVAAVVLALYWLVPLIAMHVWGLIQLPDQFQRWVSTAETMTFFTVAAAFAWSRIWPVARVALGLTLLVFGGVHLLHPAIVASLLPGWFPVPGIWPYVTGAIQIAAGVAVITGFRATVAAFAIGLMWLSWIPLVHLPRLIAAPDSGFEWTFMITALALAGAAWTVGERTAAKTGGDLPSRSR